MNKEFEHLTYVLDDSMIVVMVIARKRKASGRRAQIVAYKAFIEKLAEIDGVPLHLEFRKFFENGIVQDSDGVILFNSATTDDDLGVSRFVGTYRK